MTRIIPMQELDKSTWQRDWSERSGKKFYGEPRQETADSLKSVQQRVEEVEAEKRTAANSNAEPGNQQEEHLSGAVLESIGNTAAGSVVEEPMPLQEVA